MRIIVPVGIILLVCAARIIPGPRVVDDAFITFRYAQNLLDGHGFVYNPGELVLGTTTPLFGLLMAGLRAITGQSIPFPWLALITSTIAESITCLLLLRLGKKLGYGTAGLAAALIWAVHPYSVTFAIGGMETSVFVLLLTAAGLAHVEKRRSVAAFCAGFALLTRPDAALLVVLLASDRLIGIFRRNEEKPTGGEILAFLLPVSAWYGFAWFYYGSPLPHSITAKMGAYQLSENAALIRLLQHYALPFTGSEWLGTAGIAVGLVIYPVLFLLGSRPAITKIPAVWPLVVYPWAYLAAYAIPNPLIFRWYLTPPLPMLIFFLLIGAERVLRGVHVLAERPFLYKSTIGFFLFLFPLACIFSAWSPRMDHGSSAPAPSMAWTKLEILYEQAAEIVNSHWKTGDVVAAGDVGVLGWETRASILDLVGLNSPITGNYFPLDQSKYVINYAVPADLVMDMHPEFVVVLEVYIRKTLLKDPRFVKEYQLLEKIPTDFYGSDGMLIYQKN
jgi:hypothetical protein